MKPIWRPGSRFWATDKSLPALLLMLVVVGLVLPPLSAGGARHRIFGDVVFSLLLISGLAAVRSERRVVFRVVLAITLGALAVRWLTGFAPGNVFAGWTAAADVVVLASFAMVVLAKVLRAGTITRHRIQGAVAVYLLIGLDAM